MNLSKLSKNQKVALGIGAVILIYLVYRWQTSASAATDASTTDANGQEIDPTTGQPVDTEDTSASDYAALAGQEQSDVAALQQQNQQLSDAIDSLGSGMASGGGGGGTISAGSTPTGTPTTSPTSAASGSNTSSVPSVASGHTMTNRATINTHAGGPFYNYYVRVTGHPPPATVQVSNVIYQMWAGGVRAARAAPATHPSAPRQTRVAHPNPTHQQQANTAALFRARDRTLTQRTANRKTTRRPAASARRK